MPFKTAVKTFQGVYFPIVIALLFVLCGLCYESYNYADA